MKDYNYDTEYHLGKANLLANVYSRMVFLSQLRAQREILKDLDKKQIKFVTKALSWLEIKYTFVKKI